MRNFHPYQFIPFGGGKRLCLGNLFALTQVKTHLSMLLRFFHLRTVSGKPIKVAPKDLSSPVTGVWLRVFPRNSFEPISSHERVTPQKVQVLRTSAQFNWNESEVCILYGSNYGTTKELAEKMKRYAEEAEFKVQCTSLDECGATGLADTSLVLIFTCTYNGFPPENAKKFLADLRALNPSDSPLKHITYALFSVGNSNWHATYHRIGMEIDQLMKKLGATSLLQMTLGDKARDFENTAALWRQAVLHTLGISRDKTGINAAHVLPPSPWLQVTPVSGSLSAPSPSEYIAQATSNKEKFIQGYFGWLPCVLIENQEVVAPTTQDPDRSIRFFRIQLQEGMTFNPGDHFEIIPPNNASDVLWLCARLGVDPQAVFTASAKQAKKGGWGMGHVALFGDLLTWYCSITSVPSREDLAVMASYAIDSSEKKELLSLIASDDKSMDKYNKEIVANQQSFLHVLQRFPSVQLPIARALEIIPAKVPRLYSIASSPSTTKDQCSLCVSIVSYTTPDGNRHNGLASAFLASLKPSQVLYGMCLLFEMLSFLLGKVRPVTYMHLPPLSTPIICVCGGTGIAPFLGFLEHRESTQRESQDMLFFGCRGEYDTIFKDRLLEWKKTRNLAGLFLALSREEGRPKTYVQHLLEQENAQVKKLLCNGGYLYICGASAMANDVIKVLITMIGETQYKELLQQNFIIMDVWG